MRRLTIALAALTIAAAPSTNARTFDTVWEAVAHEYWDADLRGVDWDAMRYRYRPQALAAQSSERLYTLLDAMLGGLGDSHVYALSPAEVAYQAARDRGDAQPSFGFASYREGEAWQVYAVTPGSAAAAAGVRPGWGLLAIDGRPVDADRHPTAGEAARLTFRDEAGQERTIALVAAPAIPDPTVSTSRLPGGVLLIDIDGFEDHEDRRVAAALRDGPPPAGVILDLRDNDGGEEQTAARTAGLFFAHRQTLLRRIDRRHEARVPIAGTGARSYAGPLAVLVGARSASAAEAVAAILGESGRAVTVGERTAGALTGAEIVRLPDGGRLSIARFDVRTPGGARIEGRGYTPAHVVPQTAADMVAGRDPALAEALRLVRGDSRVPRG